MLFRDGRSAFERGEHDSARELFGRSLALWAEVGDGESKTVVETALSVTLDKMASASAGRERWQEALDLWREALEIDTRLGVLPNRAASLANVASATAQVGDVVRATGLWTEALKIYESLDDLKSQFNVLRQMANHAQRRRDWDAALPFRRRQLAVAERQGDLRNQAFVLDAIGHACFETGDAAGALDHWQRAYAAFQDVGDVRGAAVAQANVGTARQETGDTSEAMKLWRAALPVLRQLDQKASVAHVLGSMARAYAKQGDPVPALTLWEEELSLYGQLGGCDEQATVTLREMLEVLSAPRAAAKVQPSRPGGLEPQSVFSLSEYDIPPVAAPWFAVGELWALLHLNGFHLEGLPRDAIKVSRAGTATVDREARLVVGLPFDPESAAVDLVAALGRDRPVTSRALLAGYARAGYERLDVREPGFTDALLDRLGVPEPRPRATVLPLDVPTLLRALGADLSLVDGQPTLLVAGPRSEIWNQTPAESFLLLLSLLVTGVDCRALFQRDATWSGAPPLYRLLWPRAPSVDVVDLARRYPDLALALALAAKVREQVASEPIAFKSMFGVVKQTLLTGPPEPVRRLGDALIDAALRCAELTTDMGRSEALAQVGTICLQWSCRGERADEARLVKLSKTLNGRPWFPEPFAPWGAAPHLGTWNSLLLTLRDLGVKSLQRQFNKATPAALRSAAWRGLTIARRLLPLVYKSAFSADVDAVAASLPMLRGIVRSYAQIAVVLRRSASYENGALGPSGWYALLDGNAQLAGEEHWILAFAAATEEEDFSPETARPFIQSGACFYTDEHTAPFLPWAADLV
jgi:tetratricopeptide (TPR) repeat protein